MTAVQESRHSASRALKTMRMHAACYRRLHPLMQETLPMDFGYLQDTAGSMRVTDALSSASSVPLPTPRSEFHDLTCSGSE